jgi:hypothetical protein
MAHPKVSAPREYEFNEPDRAAFRTRFWRCPVRLVEDGTWAALWSAGGRRKRGGGAAGALLPVLALHAWPEQHGAMPGWTGTASLPYRRLARLAGLDKDTVATALDDLAALELVRVEVERIAHGDVRRRTRVRVAVRAFAADGERHVRFPGAFVYGGWSRLPGAAERHLCVAWAAWARAQMTDPGAGPLPRELGMLRERLGPVSGMGRTAVRKAVAELVAWRTPAGAGLVQDRGGFLRPDLDGEAALHEWPLANAEAAATSESAEATAAEPRTAPPPAADPELENSPAPASDRSGASAAAASAREGAGAAEAEEAAQGNAGEAAQRAVRPRARGGRRRTGESGDVAAAPPPLPPLAGQDAFEARKAWLVRRYLAPWAARMLRRSWQPARVAVFVDLCPGSAVEGRPSGLEAALEIAQRLRLKRRRDAPVPLEVVAVEPDPQRAQKLRSAFRFYSHARLLKVTQMPPGDCVDRFGPQQAVLVFLGAVEDEVLTVPELRLTFAKPDRELVALGRSGSPEPPVGRLWRSVRDLRQEDQEHLARLARGAIRAGARTVLSTPLVSRAGAPAGVAVHAANGLSAMPQWKSALSPRGGARQAPAQTEFRGHSGEQAQAVAEMIARAFAGRVVPWTHADWRRSPLRRYALRASALLPSELLGLRRELTARGWLASRGPLAYQFPER